MTQVAVAGPLHDLVHRGDINKLQDYVRANCISFDEFQELEDHETPLQLAERLAKYDAYRQQMVGFLEALLNCLKTKAFRETDSTLFLFDEEYEDTNAFKPKPFSLHHSGR